MEDPHTKSESKGAAITELPQLGPTLAAEDTGTMRGSMLLEVLLPMS